MPLCHIAMKKGKSEDYRKALLDGVYTALRDVLGVPEQDHFMTISEHDPANIITGNAFGIDRSEDVLYIRITLLDHRTVDQKKALYRRITELLTTHPGVRAEDIFIVLADAPPENWSVGMGETQFLYKPAGLSGSSR